VNEQDVRLRVFIVGVPRSGTTLLQSFLAAHPATTSFTESHVFSRCFGLARPFGFPVLLRDPAPRLREFLEENGVVGEAADALLGPPRRRVRAGLPLRTRTEARRILALFDALAAERGRATWIEKTPRHLRYVPFLDGLSNADRPTRFVHVIRRGADVAASLRKASRHWSRPYDLDECVRRWNADVAFSAARLQSPHDHFVTYEDLVASPEGTLRSLLEQLGLPWDAAVLEGYGAAAETLVTTDESWKSGVSRSVQPSRSSEESLTSEERRAVDAGLRDDLYERFRA